MSLHSEAMDLTEKLTIYANLDNTKYGTMLNDLIALTQYNFLSDLFYRAIIDEMKLCLINLENNTQIIKTKVIRELEYEVLEWKGVDY